MDWSVIATAIIAWVAQVVKSRKDVPTWLTQAILGGVAFGLYAVGNLPHEVAGAQAWMGWVRDGLGWAMAAIGGASVYAATGLAPKTDSLVKS